MSSPHPQFLKELVTDTTGAVAAIHVSSEGLVVGTSPGLDRDDADKWAAVMAALSAVSTNGVDIVGSVTSIRYPWGHSIIEDRLGRNLTLVGAPDKSMLAVVGTEATDLGELLDRMIRLAEQGLLALVAA
ncbi:MULTISPECIES: roadblock/LC7 domain-containing protein [Streptomycetaceae]|uniref:Roadblock/LAMTOR2 domain-containing protein n=2 Tax=Streptomyces TaxID=1883 RepID=A0A0F2T8Z7_STRR3|nr:roadblock/LC7 domain-containing protein [Streptomyces rubellomurinus]KJS59694.1 hypothetical protein VM95_25590 [Streptomyces rubellomurinus]